jgi:transposase
MTVTWRSRDELVHQVVTLAADGMAWRAISRAVGVSRNTVKAIMQAHRAQREVEHSAIPRKPIRAPRPKKVDAFHGRIAELLVQYEDLTAQRLFEILKDEGFDGGYTAVKRYVRIVRPPKRPAPSRTAPAWGPGEMAECDWSPYSIKLTTGASLAINGFAYVLPYSPRKYFGLYERSDLFALMDGHEKAFARFNGCAHRCTYDSQKAVVLRWEGTQPIYNPRFLAFAAHYDFRPRGVRGDPNAKPRVERSFWEMVRSFFNGRSFSDLDDMRLQLADWLDRIVDPRNHGRGLARFVNEEQAKLRPLPRHPYDTARVVYRVCSIEGFVDWEGNRYAVPYDHVTDILPVRITQRELFVYAADLDCVARHDLAPRGAGRKLDPAGLHPAARGKALVDLDQLRVAFDGLGEGAALFFRLLSAGSTRACRHQAGCVLRLRGRFDTKDLDAALAHAARFGALDHRAVGRILEARSSPRQLDEYVADETALRLEKLGIRRPEPWDLTEYDRLPLAPHCEKPTTPTEETTPCPSTMEAKEAAPRTTMSSTDFDDTSSSSP